MDREEKERYQRLRAAEIQAEDRMLNAVTEAVKGSKWEVPNAVMTEILVVMTSVDDDGDHCTVWINKGSWCMAEGQARRVLRDIEAKHRMDLERDDD